MAQEQTTTVEATGVLFGPRHDDPAELVDEAGHQPVIDVTRRLRPAVAPIDDKKLTPFLGYWGQLRPGQMPEAFVVKVIAVPPGQPTVPLQAARLLANEEEAARRNGLLLDGVAATGVGRGYAWVIRRYIHGLTLTQTRESGGLEGNRALLARLVLERIVELHNRTYNGHPLFHGDIKPANVIVRVEGRTIAGVELIDYESGGATGDNGPAYRHATLQFASPEHFLSPQIDRASDVFSWGLTVLDMYVPNRHPFVASLDDPRAYEEAYGTGRTADEHLLAAIDDPVLRACVRVALTVRSDDRPSARALLDRLAPLTPVPAGPVQAPTTTFELPRREAGAPGGPPASRAAGSADPEDPDATALRSYDLGAPHASPPVAVAGSTGERRPGDRRSYEPQPGRRPDDRRPGDLPPAGPSDETRVAPTQVVYLPLQPEPVEEPPLPVTRPRAGLPADTADPDSMPAQLSGWWRQLFTAEGYLGAEDFGPGHWAGYLAGTVLLAVGVGVLLASILLAVWRVLFP